MRFGRPAESVGWVDAAAPTIWKLRAEGMTLQKIATELGRRNIATAKDRTWWGATVKDVLIMTVDEFSTEAEAVIAAGFHLWPPLRKDRAKSAAPLIIKLRAKGETYATIADELNRRKIASSLRGIWYPSTVRRNWYSAMERVDQSRRAA